MLRLSLQSLKQRAREVGARELAAPINLGGVVNNSGVEYVYCFSHAVGKRMQDAISKTSLQIKRGTTKRFFIFC